MLIKVETKALLKKPADSNCVGFRLDCQVGQREADRVGTRSWRKNTLHFEICTETRDVERLHDVDWAIEIYEPTHARNRRHIYVTADDPNRSRRRENRDVDVDAYQSCGLTIELSAGATPRPDS